MSFNEVTSYLFFLFNLNFFTLTQLDELEKLIKFPTLLYYTII